MPIRILQICPHYVPAYAFGGPLWVAHSLSKALHELSCEVKVCTTNLKNTTENLDIAVDYPILQDGITVFYEPTTLLRYWGFSPRLYYRTKQLVNWADVIFVHFHYQFANWAGAFLARKSRKPYILFAHGSFNRWGIQQKSSWKKNAYIWLVEHQNIINSCFIAFNAEEERQLSLFSEKGKVIPSGVSPVDFTEMPERGTWRSRYPFLMNKLCYVYLGRLNPTQKGLDLLLPAFAQFAHERSDVHLILAGPDERGGEAKVRKMIQDLKLTQSVTLTGMITGIDKLALLNDCDVYVLASPSEGTSIALLEAMYTGLPIITTNRVGLSTRIITEKCGIVINRDKEELVNAMKKMTESNLRIEMGKRSKHLIETEYTWNVIAKKLLNGIEIEINNASHLETQAF